MSNSNIIFNNNFIYVPVETKHASSFIIQGNIINYRGCKMEHRCEKVISGFICIVR
jgi:hypothetical protein